MWTENLAMWVEHVHWTVQAKNAIGADLSELRSQEQASSCTLSGGEHMAKDSETGPLGSQGASPALPPAVPARLRGKHIQLSSLTRK